MTSRQLRSARTNTARADHSTEINIAEPVTLIRTNNSHLSCTIQPVTGILHGLSKSENTLLRRKQRKLVTEINLACDALQDQPEHFQTSLNSTLIFAQEAAGTAVCIASSGLVLTCAHCIAENEEEYKRFESTWLLFYTGVPVRARCIEWDPIRDLALLQIISIELDIVDAVGMVPCFPFVHVTSRSARINASIYCIGQPGRDDLESTTARKTTYNLVEISHGQFRGNVPDADPQDNSDIGCLKHDAWTYWGHSGAPLLNSRTGELIGLHSSWDDQTAMRHGVPLEAIREFLQRFADSGSEIRIDAQKMLGIEP